MFQNAVGPPLVSDSPNLLLERPLSHEHAEAATVLHTRVVTSTGGGPDKTILNSPRFLAPLGYRSLCAYMHPPKDAGFDAIKQRANAVDAPLLSVPDRGALDLRELPESCCGFAAKRMYPSGMRTTTRATLWDCCCGGFTR